MRPLMVVALCYLIGAFPTGILAARGWAGIDPRKAGSRNIGFTNVLRVAGTVPGIITLLGDIGKGVLGVWLARVLLTDSGPHWVLVAGLAAIIGHVFPVFLKFMGGKGVATALGVILAIEPLVGAGLLLTWLVSAAIWRTSSLAAITAFTALPVLVLLARGDGAMMVFSVVVTALIGYRHRENIKRLLAGNEPKFGARTS